MATSSAASGTAAPAGQEPHTYLQLEKLIPTDPTCCRSSSAGGEGGRMAPVTHADIPAHGSTGLGTLTVWRDGAKPALAPLGTKRGLCRQPWERRLCAHIPMGPGGALVPGGSPVPQPLCSGKVQTGSCTQRLCGAVVLEHLRDRRRSASTNQPSSRAVKAARDTAMCPAEHVPAGQADRPDRILCGRQQQGSNTHNRAQGRPGQPRQAVQQSQVCQR